MSKTYLFRNVSLACCRYVLRGIWVCGLMACQQPGQKPIQAAPSTSDNRELPVKATNPQELAQAWAESDRAKAAFLKRHPAVKKMNWSDAMSSGNLFMSDSFMIEPSYILDIELEADSLETYTLKDAEDSLRFKQHYQEDIPFPPPLGSPQAEAVLKAAYLKAFNMRKAVRGQSEVLIKKATDESEAIEKAAQKIYLDSKARPTQ
jgi:hypothetical protein